MKIFVYQCLESFFESLGEWAERMRQRFAVCSDCGRNRYTGAPCVNFGKEN